MPTTTLRALPYPASTDTPDVPRDIGALAAALDKGVFTELASGVATITITGSASGTVVVNLPAGRFTAAPQVLLTNQGGTGASACYVMVSAGPTTASFTAYAAHRDGTSGNYTVNVSWLAFR